MSATYGTGIGARRHGECLSVAQTSFNTLCSSNQGICYLSAPSCCKPASAAHQQACPCLVPLHPLFVTGLPAKQELQDSLTDCREINNMVAGAGDTERRKQLEQQLATVSVTGQGEDYWSSRWERWVWRCRGGVAGAALGNGKCGGEGGSRWGSC